MTDDDGIPWLRQIDKTTAEALCERAFGMSTYSYTVRLEIKAFEQSRTPWDATRLANALAMLNSDDPNARQLVEDLDTAAEACAGLVPNNRLKRPWA